MFAPGDEVVCVDAVRFDGRSSGLAVGRVYTVEAMLPPDNGLSFLTGTIVDGPGVLLVGHRSHTRNGTFDRRRFRKVERRNDSLSIESFLTIKPGQFEEPKRKAPAKKRERA